MLRNRVMTALLVGALANGLACKQESATPASNDTRTAPKKVVPDRATSAAAQPESTSAAASDDPHAQGKAAWAKGMCAKCHTSDGTGGLRAPDLTDSEWLHCDGSVEGIRGVLDTGVPREKLHDPDRPFGMNPVTNLVPDSEDLDALATYVHSLSQ